ncbi:renalase [Pholidichthys leucotaenia]
MSRFGSDMFRVLIVGAGLTGSLCACLLRRELQNIKIVVWDKARGTGGRMFTSRPPDASSHTADLGAQYVSATPAYAKSHHSFYEEIISAGVLRHLDCPVKGLRNDDSINYVTPQGMGSIVKHFLSQSGADLFLEHHVTALHRRGASWEVERKLGDSETFDAVVLTIPVPQILQLEGDVGRLLSVSQKQQLEGVVYSSRFALALFFPPDAVLDVPWGVWYVSDNRCICYVAVDSRKRGLEAAEILGPSLVVHTSVPFGLEHLEREKEEVQPIILAELHKLLPNLPQPVSIKCHKWRYSQVLTAVPDCPGHMTILEQPLLVAGGDAFVHSNFDGCVESALSVIGALKAVLRH